MHSNEVLVFSGGRNHRAHYDVWPILSAEGAHRCDYRLKFGPQASSGFAHFRCNVYGSRRLRVGKYDFRKFTNRIDQFCGHLKR
jgi:hypothetical protein